MRPPFILALAMGIAVLAAMPASAEGMFNRDPMDETRQTEADRERIRRLEQRQPIVREQPAAKANRKKSGSKPRKPRCHVNNAGKRVCR